MVSVSEDHETARRAVRESLAYYLFRVEQIMFAHAGADEERIATIQEVVASSGLSAGAALVDDELIDTFALAGEPSHVADRFEEYARAGVRGLIAQHVAGPERAAGLRLLADAVLPRLKETSHAS